MKIAHKSIYVAMIAIVSITGYLVFSIGRPNNLEFRERRSPEGFRELVLTNGSSRNDPILGLTGNIPVVGNEDRPKGGVRDLCDALFRDRSSPAVGSPHSKVQIVEFFDYHCPYCKTLTKILSEIQVGGGVRIVYKEWPILGNSSELAARAALAAAKQEKYLAFHMRLMNSRFIPTVAYIEDLAVELGMNQVQLLKDMNSSDITIEIQRTAALASELGFAGTPALVVGRTIVQGAITRTQLESLIDNERSLRSSADC